MRPAAARMGTLRKVLVQRSPENARRCLIPLGLAPVSGAERRFMLFTERLKNSFTTAREQTRSSAPVTPRQGELCPHISPALTGSIHPVSPCGCFTLDSRARHTSSLRPPNDAPRPTPNCEIAHFRKLTRDACLARQTTCSRHPETVPPFHVEYTLSRHATGLGFRPAIHLAHAPIASPRPILPFPCAYGRADPKVESRLITYTHPSRCPSPRSPAGLELPASFWAVTLLKLSNEIQ